MKHLRYIILLPAALLVSCKQEVYHNVTINVEPPEGGSVVMNPSSGQVLEGTSVTFTAQPKGDYVFSSWSRSFSGTENPKTVTVSSDLTVTANFALREYPLSISIEGEGSVSERVISTKTDYSSGTVVELTALPATGWSFDHWEGDLTGVDNPISITISSAKTVKAIFTKNHYAYNLRIVGPGVVDEYLVEDTRASLEYGTTVLLKAIPSDGAVFIGWSGDVSGSSSTLFVSIDEKKEIVASFSKLGLQYPLADLMQPSAKMKTLYPEIDFSLFSGHSHGYLALDYNRDGFLDIISIPTDWSENSRYPLRFYLSNENGEFYIDELNDLRIIGPNNNRKSVFGDFNGDGFPDIALIGHGYDCYPWPGEYPIILFSQSGPIYKDVRFPAFVSYYHGGASGDIDNDGDIDLFLVDTGRGKTLFLVNDGTGSFSTKTDLIDQSLMAGMTIAELFDLDHDGNIDIICAGDDTWGSDHIGWPWEVHNMPIVFWGDGSGRFVEYDRFPESHVRGYDGTIDMTFFDLNGDGKEEIIMSRTGSLVNEVDVIERWALQILEVNGRALRDVTEQYLDYDDSFSMVDDNMLFWIEFDEYEGTTYLIATKNGPNAQFYFKLENGRLIPVWDKGNHEDHRFSCEEGFCVYSDSFGQSGGHWDPSCKDNPYGGNTCISIDEWTNWEGFSLWHNDEWVDFSAIVDENYCLEFAIKNSDPALVVSFNFETLLQTDPWYFPTYFCFYRADEHRADGEWEVIRIPLKDCLLDEEWEGGFYWNTIKSIYFSPYEYNGESFFLDEIRIRKVLPE